MRTNKTVRKTKKVIECADVATKYTHEGAVASNPTMFEQLKRSVCASLLWESSFYENGEDHGQRVAKLIGKCDPQKVANLAVECRTKMKLRHMPLFMAVQMWKYAPHKQFVGDVLSKVIQRADEPAEVLSMWLKMVNVAENAKKTIPRQIKRGINIALDKFTPYQLSKYKGNGKEISLKDVILLTHPNRKDVFKQIIDGTIEPPHTWEVEYSKAGNDPAKKKQIWLDLISENKLGALAFLRNLRNMISVDVPKEIMRDCLKKLKTERVLPFRFITASKYAPFLNDELEQCMFKCLESAEKLSGHTALLVDVSGSMYEKLSIKSDAQRNDCANGLAMLLREICENVQIFTFSERVVEIPNRRGFALAEKLDNSQTHSCTYLNRAIKAINDSTKYDRLIVITDEQAHDTLSEVPQNRGYIINVASYENGVGYENFVKINGWSESIIDYIVEYEKLDNPVTV